MSYISEKIFCQDKEKIVNALFTVFKRCMSFD